MTEMSRYTMACVRLCKANGAESKSRAKMVTRLTSGHFHYSGQALRARTESENGLCRRRQKSAKLRNQVK